VRENCMHGSEGGDGESRFRPLSKTNNDSADKILEQDVSYETPPGAKANFAFSFRLAGSGSVPERSLTSFEMTSCLFELAFRVLR
jgi:hypothetical protein